MGENEEKKGQTSVKTPQEQIQDFQQQQKEAAEQQEASIKATNDAYQQGFQQRSEQLNTAMTAANETAKQAGVTYVDMVQGWYDAAKAEAEEQRKRNEAQEKRDLNYRMYGGLAEAASALVNLIGTTKGAVSQKWESPQQKWAERSDALRRERDKKLENLRSQMKTLQQQKAQLQYNLGKDDADRQMQAATMAANRGDQAAQQRYQGEMAAAQTKAQGVQQGIALGMQGLNMLLNEKNAAEGRKIQWANNKRLQEQNEFTQRSYGYDPDSGKWWNPKTKAYDLDAPADIRGDKTTPKPKDLDGALREAMKMDSSVMDELVKNLKDKDGNSYFSNYADYTSSVDDKKTKKTREKAVKSKSDVYKLIRKFEDASDLVKFTAADVNLLQQYAPEFYAKYGESIIGATATTSTVQSASGSKSTTSSPKKADDLYEYDQKGFPVSWL